MTLKNATKFKDLPDRDKRILVRRPHAHGGKTGTVEGYIKTIVGVGAIVKFDDSLKGTVFQNAKWEYV